MSYEELLDVKKNHPKIEPVMINNNVLKNLDLIFLMNNSYKLMKFQKEFFMKY
jgi:hypothetical protein